MFDIPLRRLKDSTCQPLTHLIPSSISPNLLTLLAFLFGLLSCYYAAYSPSPVVPSTTLWLVNRILDCLDGSLARSRGVATEVGGFLDLLSDFIIYSLIPICIAYGQDRVPLGLTAVTVPSADWSPPDWRAVAILEASFHINNFILFYIAAVASKRDSRELTSVTMRPALVEGFEAGVIFTVMLAAPHYITLLSWGMAGLVGVGIVQRAGLLIPTLRNLDEGKYGSKEENGKVE